MGFSKELREFNITVAKCSVFRLICFSLLVLYLIQAYLQLHIFYDNFWFPLAAEI